MKIENMIPKYNTYTPPMNDPVIEYKSNDRISIDGKVYVVHGIEKSSSPHKTLITIVSVDDSNEVMTLNQSKLSRYKKLP